MAGRAGKLEEAEKLMKKANKLWQPSLLDLRLKPDWEAAAPLFEKAALAFKVGSAVLLFVSSKLVRSTFGLLVSTFRCSLWLG